MQGQILTGAVEALHGLLTAGNLETSLIHALAALGKSARVDRVALFEKRVNQHTKVAQFIWRFEWVKEDALLEAIPNPPGTFPYGLDCMQVQPVIERGEAFIYPPGGLAGNLSPSPTGPTCSVVVLPVLADEHTWGIMCLEDQDIHRQWSPDTIHLLLKAAKGFGGAIWREQIEQDGYQQRVLAEALYETANALNQSLRLNVVLDRILSHIGTVVPHDSANIMLIYNGCARVVACRGYENLGGKERVMKQVRPITEIPNLKRMAETGQPIIVPDTHDSQEWVNFETSQWIRSYASAPICREGKTIGFLNLNSSTPGFYNADSAKRLLVFASQAAIAIENARLFENAQLEIANRKRTENALTEAKNELEARVEQRTLELRQANEQLRQELERRQEAEQALEQERALLAQRVEERTAELSAANAELARAAQMKDNFLASMSHELRTPLNAILNISETLQELVYGEMNEAQMRSVRMIEESGHHLLSLINDILDLSKIGAGRFELLRDLVPVKAVCEASLQLVEEAARKKHLTVTSTLDPNVKTIWADQRRLKQVLVNLLSNAVKFTPSGGTVSLTVIGDPEKNQVRFIVSDTGIGIPKESLNNLFKPFVQLDNGLARQYEGTGLGLALAYNLVKLHGGGITVDSELGKGSQFTITLNWSEKRAEQYRAPQSNADPFSSAQEGGVGFDPLSHIHMYMGELGIEVQNFWITVGTSPQRGQFPNDYGILVVNERLLNGKGKNGQVQRLLGELSTWPVIVLANQASTIDEAKLPRNIGLLRSPFDRKQMRAVIKKISPNGTASLIRCAIILQEKNAYITKDQPLILLVDDNETTLRISSEYLNAKGFRVILASNGQDAINRARETQPDLIVMDIQMPGMSGLEAIREIRADSLIRSIPILALTALAMPGDRELCLKAGANEYLSKPIGLHDFIDAIQRYLQPA